VAGRTRDGARTRFGASAVTLIAAIELLELNLLFNTESRFLKCDLHIVAQIRATMSIFCARAYTAEKRLEDSATESAAAKDFTENVERIVKAAETDTAWRKRSVAVPIEGSSFLRIHENVISFAKFFEFLLGVRVIRIFIWMKLDGELAVSAFDLLFGGVPANPKHFIVVAFLRGGHVAMSPDLWD
jgi:hypothetical protein